jgi:hypothetical protein
MDLAWFEYLAVGCLIMTLVYIIYVMRRYVYWRRAFPVIPPITFLRDQLPVKALDDGLVSVSVVLPAELLQAYCHFLESLADFFRAADRQSFTARIHSNKGLGGCLSMGTVARIDIIFQIIGCVLRTTSVNSKWCMAAPYPTDRSYSERRASTVPKRYQRRI